MGKKGKKGKDKKKDKEGDLDYKLLTLEEVKARETKYQHRLNSLRICLNFIDGRCSRKNWIGEYKYTNV